MKINSIVLKLKNQFELENFQIIEQYKKGSWNLNIKYTSNTTIIIKTPTTENQIPPFFSNHETKGFPNFTEK